MLCEVKKMAGVHWKRENAYRSPVLARLGCECACTLDRAIEGGVLTSSDPQRIQLEEARRLARIFPLCDGRVAESGVAREAKVSLQGESVAARFTDVQGAAREHQAHILGAPYLGRQGALARGVPQVQKAFRYV
jgi:hypothetical protein